ncbi:MAG: TonB-dependent receptor [Bacteroidales bacterium]|nr:TonB-dependent receptor [Bacteroidales bacterium]
MLFQEMTKDLSLIRIYVSLVILYLLAPVFSQEVRITCTNQPLNKILIDLRDDYGLMVSFDDKQLSAYKITADKKFASPSRAFDYLLKGLPLGYEVSDDVYIIFSVPYKVKPRNYIISGRISDKTSRETLPYSGIYLNNTIVLSDAKGNFSFTSATDSIFSVRISYLGYYILDTMVGPGTHHNFMLTPSVIALEEIIVIGSEVARSIQTGTSPGISRMNHKIAYYLPGNGDNSIFNLLRLQPGILAAGEQSADFIIWGSYEGQSQVIFDGFTIYGMKNFNDNISAVNPYVAKDIKVLKGGFGAEYGERVGGIVDITGKDGNRLSPSVQFCINNMTLNGTASIPFRKKSALMLAYRQTFYPLYNSFRDSTLGFGRGRNSGGADYYLDPDYGFRDMNVKYSGSGKKSNYYISLYGGMDHFSYEFEQESLHRSTLLDYSEHNTQIGGTAYYGFRWKDKYTSNLTVSYSTLQTDRDMVGKIERTSGNWNDEDIDEQTRTVIYEINSRTDNKLTLSEKHIADAGLGWIYYITNQEITNLGIRSDEMAGLHIPYLYLQDNITLFTRLTLRPGLRSDFHSISRKVYVQPRLSLMYRFYDYFRLNAAAGMYNQFVAKNMIMDDMGNYKLEWAICDDKNVKVLNSHGYTLGFSFNKNDFTVNVEGYLKYTGGLTRFLQTSAGTIPYEGEGKTKGIDLFVKKEFKNQSLWASYTLSKTQEYFPYFPTDEYIPAMHDQRHEVKVAGLAKIKSFHFSANYVYGSGFPDPDKLPATVEYTSPYNRLDGAIIYRFLRRKIHLDAGISVLNILNTENIRYSNLIRIPAEETGTESLYADAVPRTWALFLNIYY